MGHRTSVDVSIVAGQQFLGSEFHAVPSKPNHILVVRELAIKLGAEAKSIFVEKVYSVAGVAIRSQRLVVAASTATDVVVTGADIETLLTGSSQLQVRSTGATSAMVARIEYEEVDDSYSRTIIQPIVP